MAQAYINARVFISVCVVRTRLCGIQEPPPTCTKLSCGTTLSLSENFGLNWTQAAPDVWTMSRRLQHFFESHRISPFSYLVNLLHSLQEFKLVARKLILHVAKLDTLLFHLQIGNKKSKLFKQFFVHMQQKEFDLSFRAAKFDTLPF